MNFDFRRFPVCSSSIVIRREMFVCNRSRFLRVDQSSFYLIIPHPRFLGIGAIFVRTLSERYPVRSAIAVCHNPFLVTFDPLSEAQEICSFKIPIMCDCPFLPMRLSLRFKKIRVHNGIHTQDEKMWAMSDSSDCLLLSYSCRVSASVL